METGNTVVVVYSRAQAEKMLKWAKEGAAREDTPYSNTLGNIEWALAAAERRKAFWDGLRYKQVMAEPGGPEHPQEEPYGWLLHNHERLGIATLVHTGTRGTAEYAYGSHAMLQELADLLNEHGAYQQEIERLRAQVGGE